MKRRRDEKAGSDDHNARGIELADRGWLDEAASEFNKAIKLDPRASQAYDNLGTVYAEQGKLYEALGCFQEALKVEPDSPAAHHYLASFLAASGQDLAIACYRRAIDLEYDFPDAHLNLGLALAERDQLDDAVAELEIAHSQAPEDELIEHELAGCLIEAERYPDAIGHLKSIVRTHPEHVEAHVDLGLAYSAQGFYAQAEGALKRALEIDGNDFVAHYHMAALYSTWKRPDEALKHLELASAQDQERVRDWLKEDQLFDPIREMPRFLQVLGKLDT